MNSTDTTATVKTMTRILMADDKKKVMEYTYGTEKFMVNAFDLHMIDIVNHIPEATADATPQNALSQEITKRLEFKYSDVNFRVVGGRLNFFANLGIISKKKIDNGWRLWFSNKNTQVILDEGAKQGIFSSSYDDMSDMLSSARQAKAENAAKVKVGRKPKKKDAAAEAKATTEAAAAALLEEDAPDAE